MSFSSLGRSLVRSARSRSQSAALLGGFGTRSGVLNETLLQSPCFRGDNGGLQFLRGYLTSIGASKAVGAGNHLYDWTFLLANPSFKRFFSSESPRKKNYENYYPKNKKEIPKGDGNNKSDSKEDSSADDHGNFQENFMKQLKSFLAPLIFIGLLLSSFSTGSFDQKEEVLSDGFHVVVSSSMYQ